MTELVAIVVLWAVCTLLLTALFLYTRKKSKQDMKKDYIPLHIAMIFWEVFFTILCIAVIIAYAK